MLSCGYRYYREVNRTKETRLVPHIFAYLDAGTGSMLIQAAIAGLVAIPIVFRRHVGNAARAVRRMTGRAPDETTSTASAAGSPAATTDTTSH
jgi:hypothetical protein